MTLRLGSKLTAELNHIGHTSGSSHLVYLFDPAAPFSYSLTIKHGYGSTEAYLQLMKQYKCMALGSIKHSAA